MLPTQQFVWKATQTIIYIIFIGLCIETGALLFNFVYSFFQPIATKNLYLGLNLYELHAKSVENYVGIFSCILIISFLKCSLFFKTIQLFKQLNFVKPFSESISKRIEQINVVAFNVGLIGYIAHHYAKRLVRKGFDIHDVETFWNDNGAYLLMAAIIYIIAMIFKKGIELQNENDLTV